MNVKTQLRDIGATIETMNEQLSVLEDGLNDTIHYIYGIDLKIKDIVSSMSNEDIDSMTEEVLIEHLTSLDPEKTEDSPNGDISLVEDMEFSTTNLDALKDAWESDNHWKSRSFIEYGRFVFKEIKDGLTQLNDFKSQSVEMTEKAREIQEKYFNYISSPEYKAKRRAAVQKMREEAENETDPDKKRSIVKMLDAIDSANTLNFLFDRINKVGTKEIESIKNSFFDSARSSMIMKKYETRLPRYGYEKNIHRKFFNLEEMFLPEEYHVFNNMFLFHVMRFISYTDSYNKIDTLYVSAILLNLYNLVYHRFESPEAEAEFISVIKRFDNYFEPYRDYINEHNATHPGHPARIKYHEEREKEEEEKRRLMIIAGLQNAGIEPDTNLDTETLKAMLNDVIAKEKAEEIQTEELLENSDDESLTDATEKESENLLSDRDDNKYDSYLARAAGDDINSESGESDSNSGDHIFIGYNEEQTMSEEDQLQESDSNSESIDLKHEVYDGEDILVHDEAEDEEVSEVIDRQVEYNETVIFPDKLFKDIPIDGSGFSVKLSQSFITVANANSTVVSEESALGSNVYIDKYDCVYIRHMDKSYGYYDLFGKSYGNEIDETTILRLLSTGSLRKLTPYFETN